MVLVHAPGADAETLAHEIGHALALCHTEKYPPASGTLPTDNLMESGGVNRASITEAQCFRANADAISWLNLLGIRNEFVLECIIQKGDPIIENPRCPRIANDILHDISPVQRR